MRYDLKPNSVEDILKLISRSHTGRKVLENFLPLYHKNKVAIDTYPADIVSQLRQVLPEGQPIGACFTPNGGPNNGAVIYLDFTSPIGILAPFLVHEMVHALDKRVWSGKTQNAGDVLFAVESLAFETQFRFTQELKERDAEYETFLASHYPKAKILHTMLTLEDIEQMYSGNNEPLAA